MAIASIINTLHRSGPDIILYLIFHIPRQTESPTARHTMVSLDLKQKNPAYVFGCSFFQGTDATVGDGLAPLGPPLLPWENRMGRGHIQI